MKSCFMSLLRKKYLYALVSANIVYSLDTPFNLAASVSLGCENVIMLLGLLRNLLLCQPPKDSIIIKSSSITERKLLKSKAICNAIFDMFSRSESYISNTRSLPMNQVLSIFLKPFEVKSPRLNRCQNFAFKVKWA